MKFKCLSLVLFALFCFCSFAFAEEKITITTYYPSPYGSYNQLQADKFGVGDNNSDGSFTSSDVPIASGDVWIKGNVGIGSTQTTVSPLKKLILKGLGTTTGIGLQVLDSSNTVLLTTLDNGNVGIGSTFRAGGYTPNLPTDKLQIDSAMAFHSGGQKVIGFGWSPGANEVLMPGFPAEIRWIPSSGLLQLGVDPTYKCCNASPNIIPAITIVPSVALGVSGSVGIGTTSPNTKVKLDVLNNTAQAQLGQYQSGSTTTYTGCTGAKLTCDASATVCANCCGGVWINPPCFTKEMRVELEKGSKPISEIKKGDIIKSFDLKNKKVVYSKVKDVKSRSADSYLLINKKIEVTEEHPFYTKNGWVKAKDLKVGQLLFDGANYIPVKVIRTISKKVTVYNLSVEGQENFFVENLLVHNKPVDYCSNQSNNSACSSCAAVGTSSCNTTCCAGTQLCSTSTGVTSIGVKGIDTAGSSTSWAGYFAGKLETTSNMIVGGSLTTVGNASITGTLSAGSINTNSITLSGVNQTSWPTMSCRNVVATSGHYATCLADEYLTGGGCYWREIEDSGTDDVHGHPDANNNTSSLGGRYYCDSGSGNGLNIYAVCCK